MYQNITPQKYHFDQLMLLLVAPQGISVVTQSDLFPKGGFCNRLKRGGDCRWKILPECSVVPQLGSGNRGERALWLVPANGATTFTTTYPFGSQSCLIG